MDLRGQLLEDKQAEVEAKKRALDEREMREGGAAASRALF